MTIYFFLLIHLDAVVVTSGCDKCGACVDLSNKQSAGVILDGNAFSKKPSSAVSVAVWISLNNTQGMSSIFQAMDDSQTENMFNLASINGKLHWRHKDKNGKILFYVKTKEVVVPEALWTHVAATYNSQNGIAKLYVNGLLKQQTTNPKRPLLSQAWRSGTIGDHLPEHRLFNGLLDEFFMYNWELDPSEIGFVLKYCADHPKLVSFTVRVPLL